MSNYLHTFKDSNLLGRRSAFSVKTKKSQLSVNLLTISNDPNFSVLKCYCMSSVEWNSYSNDDCQQSITQAFTKLQVDQLYV